MSERDELRKVIFGYFGPTYAINAYKTADQQDDELAAHILAAGYRKTEPSWAETLVNDGAYEYTTSSDCDGSNVKHWRRVPGKTYEGKASSWESFEPEPQS